MPESDLKIIKNCSDDEKREYLHAMSKEKYGLGYIIQQSSSRGRTDLVFMAIIVIMIISVIFDFSAKWLVKHIFKWRYING